MMVTLGILLAVAGLLTVYERELPKWKTYWSPHTRRTWVFACSWTYYGGGELAATLGLGKWSLHGLRRRLPRDRHRPLPAPPIVAQTGTGEAGAL